MWLNCGSRASSVYQRSHVDWMGKIVSVDFKTRPIVNIGRQTRYLTSKATLLCVYPCTAAT